MSSGHRRRWSSVAVEAAAPLLFRSADLPSFTRAEFEVAAGPALRLASLAAAAGLVSGAADNDPVPSGPREALTRFSTQALLSSHFELAQALDLWSLLWRGCELNGQMRRESDLPKHAVTALLRTVEDRQPLAWWATAHHWVNAQRAELERLVQRAKEIDRALASDLLDGPLRELDASLAAGACRSTRLADADFDVLVRGYARQHNFDASGRRVHHMPAALRAVAQQAELIVPYARWAVPPPDGLAEVTVLLSELVQVWPALADVFHTIAEPVRFGEWQEELDELAVALLETLDDEQVRITAARELHAVGARATLIDQALDTVRELERQLSELEAGTGELPGEAQDMLALAREALDGQDVRFGAECIANYHRYMDWTAFRRRVATLDAEARDLPEAEREQRLRMLRLAEAAWRRWDDPAAPADDARRLLADLARGALAGRSVPESPPVEVAVGQPVTVPVSEAKRLFETKGAAAAIEAAWPDRSHCPDAPTRYFLFRVLRVERDADLAGRLLATAEAAGSARAFDYAAYCRVLLAAGDHVGARAAFDKARSLGADDAIVRSIRRELTPAPPSERLPSLTGSTVAEVLAWLDRVGAVNVSDEIAREIVDTQHEENGPKAAAEVVLRLGPTVPSLAGRYVTRLTRPQITALEPGVRAELAKLLAGDTVDVIDRCANLFFEARCEADAIALLQQATGIQHKRGLLRVQRLLLRFLATVDADEAERVLAEQVFPRPGGSLSPQQPIVAEQPASQPFGEANVRPTSYVQEARRATESDDPAAADLWVKVVREDRRLEALATALHYIIVAGKPAEALRLVADRKVVPVAALPWVGVQWNLACAYARLGHNDTAAALFGRHAEWMDRPYLPADARAVARIFDVAGETLPPAYRRALVSADAAPAKPSGPRLPGESPHAAPGVTTDLHRFEERLAEVIFTSRREERPPPTVDEIRAHPAMTDVRTAADSLLERYYLLRPARIERSWGGAREATTDVRVGQAAALLAEGELGDATDELRRAWERQPTHEGILRDLVGLLAAQGRHDEARTVADAGGERALRHDLLAAVAAAEQRDEQSVARLVEAQRMEPSEVRAFAMAAMAMRLEQRASAVRFLADEALRHVPGQLRLTGATAVVLADEEGDQEAVAAILDHCRRYPSAQHIVDCVVRNDVPVDLPTVTQRLTPEHLEQLAEGFAERPRQLNQALYGRVHRLSGAERRPERRMTYEFLVTRELDEGSVRSAAEYFHQYERDFGREVTAQLRETAERKYLPFRRALLETRKRFRTISADELKELNELSWGARSLLPNATVQQFREAVTALAALPMDVLLQGSDPVIEAVFVRLREVMPPTPENNVADDLEHLWRAQLAAAREVLHQGRALSHSEYTEARQRRTQIYRLCRDVDPWLVHPLRDLGQAFYEPWKATNRPRRPGVTPQFRPTGAASRALFAGRDREFDQIKTGFGKLADRGGWEIHHVHGPSGMGKSSLAKALTPRSDTEVLLIPGVVPLWINCYSLASAVERHRPLFAELAQLAYDRHNTIRSQASQLGISEVDPPEGIETGRDFVRWVDRSLPPGTAWLLLLDEFDHLARLPRVHELVSELRQARDEEGHAFGAVVLSRFSPRRLDQMLGGVQLEAVDVTLDLLDAAATRAVLERGMPPELTLSAEAHSRAYEVTQGFPPHVQHLGNALVSQHDGERGELGDAAVEAAVARYRNDPDLVESQLLPRTIQAQDYRRSMRSTLELLGDRLSVDREAPEAELLEGLDSDRRQQAREHLRLMAEAGLLVRDGELFGWLNTIIRNWAVRRFSSAGTRAVSTRSGLGDQLRAAGFALVRPGREKQVLRRSARTYDAVPIPIGHRGEVESLLSRAFRGLPPAQRTQFDSVYDEHAVLLRPYGETSLSYRVRTATVEIDQAVDWIIDAANALVSVEREAGLAHGWLSLDRLVDTGGRIWITGWGESAVARAAHRWPSKWEAGHVRRQPEGIATAQDDAFALAVILARLLSYTTSGPETLLDDPPCKTGENGVADPKYLNLPRLNVVDDPDGRYVRLMDLLRTLLQSPSSPRAVRDALLTWAGRAAVTPTPEVRSQIELRLRPQGNTDWRVADVPLEVTAVCPDSPSFKYHTILSGHAWEIYSRFVQDVPAMQSAHELAQLGGLLREALFGRNQPEAFPLDSIFADQDPAGPVLRVVIVGAAELQRLPWEMAAVAPNKALADVASVVRRLDDHAVEPGELYPPVQHLVLGRQASTMPPGIVADHVSHDWVQFRRHQGRETIFHFLGEGEPGVLACGDDGCDLDLLGDLLFSRNILLAVLTACNSNAPDNAGGSTALRLVGSGVPAVVAMSGKVQTDTANEFAATLLERLRETGDVELSLHDARRRMVHGYVWNGGLPVLYLSTVDGKLFAPSRRR